MLIIVQKKQEKYQEKQSSTKRKQKVTEGTKKTLNNFGQANQQSKHDEVRRGPDILLTGQGKPYGKKFEEKTEGEGKGRSTFELLIIPMLWNIVRKQHKKNI